MNDIKTSLKLWLKRKKPMSPDGIRRWGLQQRRHIYRYVFSDPLYFKEVPVSILSTNQTMAEWIMEYYDDGDEIYVFGYSKGKTRTGVKLVCLAKIKILDRETKQAQVTTTIKGVDRLNRYWFRKKT